MRCRQMACTSRGLVTRDFRHTEHEHVAAPREGVAQVIHELEDAATGGELLTDFGKFCHEVL